MSHDVGGLPTHDAIARDEHPFAAWELRVDALLWLLRDPARPGGPHLAVDELRRGIEALDPDDARDLPYYAKWLRSMIAILDERGVVDAAAVERRARDLQRDPHPA